MSFVEDMRAFSERASELGLPDTSRYYWYHTIDLGDGLVTPGMYDYRQTISAFQFPDDMSGMTCLLYTSRPFEEASVQFAL